MSRGARKREQRARLFDRQGGLCFWCQVPMVLLPPEPFRKDYPPDMATIEHTISRAHMPDRRLGGVHVVACYDCNQTRSLLETAEVPLFERRVRAGRLPRSMRGCTVPPTTREVPVMADKGDRVSTPLGNGTVERSASQGDVVVKLDRDGRRVALEGKDVLVLPAAPVAPAQPAAPIQPGTAPAPAPQEPPAPPAPAPAPAAPVEPAPAPAPAPTPAPPAPSADPVPLSPSEARDMLAGGSATPPTGA